MLSKGGQPCRQSCRAPPPSPPAHRKHARPRAAELDGRHRIARIDRPYESVSVDYINNVRRGLRAEQRGGARQQVFAEGGGGRKHVAEAGGAHEGREELRGGLWQLVGQQRRVGEQHLCVCVIAHSAWLVRRLFVYLKAFRMSRPSAPQQRTCCWYVQRAI